MAITITAVEKGSDSVTACMSNLTVAVLNAHWSVMRSLLKAEGSDCAKLNAILRVGKAMDAAVAAAKEIDDEFFDEHRDGLFDD